MNLKRMETKKKYVVVDFFANASLICHLYTGGYAGSLKIFPKSAAGIRGL